MTQTAALYHVQVLDTQADKIRARLAEIDRLLGQTDAITAAHSALAEAEQAESEWRHRQTACEQERDHLQDEAKVAEARLYSGQVHNPRELTDLQDKLAELAHRRDSLEEPILEAMLAVEEAAKTIKVKQQELQRLMDERAQQAGELEAERMRLTGELTSLEAEVQQARTLVQAPHLMTYDKIRPKAGGMPVAMITGSGCGACGVELSSQLVQRVRHDEVILCPTCGRILCVQ